MTTLAIYIGHSGDKIDADASRISTLDALRGFVERRAAIPVKKQVFLTAKGKQVRPATLLNEVGTYAVVLRCYDFWSQLELMVPFPDRHLRL